ncbi:MAG TPA: triose-phosphate isomerase [Spirochaetes bacterium]|nr:triose-phosphate isomerase [Spirochaetota bacterium]
MRKPLIAGNFKMHKTINEVVDYAKGLMNSVQGVSDRDILICPPFTALSEVFKIIEGSHIALGAQNMHYESKGAFTGELSSEMLRDAGCDSVILGHSERRHILKEEDSFINLKVKKAVESNLRAIFCVGELLEEREGEMAEAVVKRQIELGLKGLSETDMEKIVIAYEPVWAIGTGKTASPDDAQTMHSFIRKTIVSLFNTNVAESLVIQYGGSVKPANINDLMAMPDIDGALVGGACLEVDSFSKIITFT